MSCVNNPTDTTKDMDSKDAASVASASEIHRIVRETLLYFKLRHIGYYLPEKIRKGNFKDNLPEFPFPLNSKPLNLKP